MRSTLTFRPAARAGVDGAPDVGRVVRALEGGEHRRHRGLHPDADPGEASVGEDAQRLRRDRVGVGLGGDLGVGSEAEPLADAGQHAHQVVRRQQGRRAAADEDGRHGRGAGPEHRGREVKLGQRRVGVGGHARAVNPELGQRVGVEVAVAATDAAERNVDVDAEGATGQLAEGGPGQLPRRRGGLPVGQGAGHGPSVSGAGAAQPEWVSTPYRSRVRRAHVQAGMLSAPAARMSPPRTNHPGRPSRCTGTSPAAGR